MKHPKTQRPFFTRTLLGASVLALAACSAGDPVATAATSEGSPEAAVLEASNGNATDTQLAEIEPQAEAPSEAETTPDTLADPAPASAPVADSTPEPTSATSPTATMTADSTPESDSPEAPASSTPQREVATLGAGCFWCIEAVLEQVDGVESVVSGYMGGQTLNPTYKQICTGQTGHAEVVQVTFDPTVLSYKDLLDWFWKSHDPTTLNRQGNDRGTQYRSAIFTHSDTQRTIAETSKKDVQPTFDDPIVTEITPAATFYEAEEYHQGYYFDNTRQGYCRMVIAPKLKKLGLKY